MRRLGLALVVVAFASPVFAQSAPEEIDVVSTPIERFGAATPVGAAFGKLTFLGGLQLKSTDRDFGGLSGLRLSADGRDVTAISDRGNMFRGALEYDGSRPVALRGVTRGAIPGRDGRPLVKRRGFDTEALEIEGATAWVTSEKAHWLTRYALGPDGRPTGAGKAVALPKAALRAPRDAGYESMARLASGAIMLVAENYPNEDGDNRAFVVGGKAPFEFAVRRTEDFSPTDLARLPGGDLILLERRYRPLLSLNIRLKRLPASAIAPGATVDGEIVLEASLAQTIDNFEGLAIHKGPDGATVLTVVSDDNFSGFQRTLLMQFALRP